MVFRNLPRPLQRRVYGIFYARLRRKGQRKQGVSVAVHAHACAVFCAVFRDYLLYEVIRQRDKLSRNGVFGGAFSQSAVYYFDLRAVPKSRYKFFKAYVGACNRRKRFVYNFRIGIFCIQP